MMQWPFYWLVAIIVVTYIETALVPLIDATGGYGKAEAEPEPGATRVRATYTDLNAAMKKMWSARTNFTDDDGSEYVIRVHPQGPISVEQVTR